MYFKIFKPISWGKRHAERRRRFIQRFPSMNCFSAFIMSASFGLGRFREINTSRTILRRYRAEETAEETTFRGRLHGGRLKARIAHQRFIFLTASVSAPIIAHCLIKRNKIFILLRLKKELRSARKIAGCYSVISDTGYFGAIPLFSH